MHESSKETELTGGNEQIKKETAIESFLNHFNLKYESNRSNILSKHILS